MNQKSSTELRWRLLVLVLILGFALLCVFRISSSAHAGDANEQQDVLRLENRITQLEQRLFSIENNVRNLDQQSRLSSMPSRSSQDELTQLRSEVETLQRRLANDECGLAKLDERTLSPQRREARKRSIAGDSEPCRVNFDAPLRLP